jgi:hypothetical protein
MAGVVPQDDLPQTLASPPTTQGVPVPADDLPGGTPAADQGAADAKTFSQYVMGVPLGAEEQKGYQKGQAAYARGVGLGIERPFAGAAQAITQGLAKTGALDPEVANAITNAQADLEKKAGYSTDPGVQAGDLMGESLTYLMGVGGVTKAIPALKAVYEGARLIPKILASSAISAGLGATQFQEPGEEQSRAEQAFFGALTGTAAESGASLVSRGAVKFANMAAIKDYINNFKDFVNTYKATNDTLPKLIRMKAQVIDENRGNLYAQRNQIGDRIYPSIDVSDVRNTLQGLVTDAKARFGRAIPQAGKVLQQALDSLDPQISGVTIKGQRIDANSPAGKAVLQALAKQNGGNPPVNYSALDQAYLDLKSFYKTAAAGSGEAERLMAQGVKSLRDKLKSLEAANPTLRRAAVKAEAFYKDMDLPGQTQKLQEILNAEGVSSKGPTSLQANKKITGIFSGDSADPIMAERLWRMMGAPARQITRQAVINDVLLEAMNKSGRIDPAIVANRLSNLPTRDMLFPKGTPLGAAVDGINSIISSSAKAIGETKVPSHKFHSGWLPIMGAYSLLRGEMKEAEFFFVPYFTLKALNMVVRALGDHTGINFLAAAGRASDGTPEYARILKAMLSRYSATPAAIPAVRQGVGGNLASGTADVGSTVGNVLGSLL